MEKMNSFIEYLKSLFVSLSNNVISLGYEPSECSTLIYHYMIDDSKDLSEFDLDYFNCDDYNGADKKSCLCDLMCAIYVMMEFYGANEEFSQNTILSIIDCYDENNRIFTDLFQIDDFGIQVIDAFFNYLEFSEARRKKISTKLCKNKDFLDFSLKNKYLYAVFVNDISLNVTEEAYLVDDVITIYEDVNIFKKSYDNSFIIFNEINKDLISDYVGFNKVKKILMLQSLVRDLNSNKENYHIKHIFSIMLKNIYADMYLSKINHFREISEVDNNFLELIESNNLSFDELFRKFVDDEKFSSYLIGNFYFYNLDKDQIDFEKNEYLCKKYNLDEKIKKYYM